MNLYCEIIQLKGRLKKSLKSNYYNKDRSSDRLNKTNMNLKNKIAAAALCALIAGIGIFSESASATPGTNPEATPTIEELQQTINSLTLQIQQLSQQIAILKPLETCGNGICRFGETAASCPADCDKTKPICGNGVCDAGEGDTSAYKGSCPADCSGSSAKLLPNGSKCALKSDCVSANCSYGVCCNTTQCGWGDGGADNPRMCVDSDSQKENQWLKGVCLKGAWKTVSNGIGCNTFACDYGTCINNTCVNTGAIGTIKTCYGEGEGEIGMTTGAAIPCCFGLTAQPRTTTYSNGTQATTEGFICKKPVVVASCKKEGESFGYLEGECCDGLFKVYSDGAKTYSSGENQNFQVTCKKSATFITGKPNNCVIANIKAGINNKYVTAENAGAGSLIANRDTAGIWEEFVIIPLNDGSVSIKANINGKYVTAENAGAGSLIANRDTAGIWEEFFISSIANTNNATIKAATNNRYVTAENAGAGSLIANRDTAGIWEEFTITKIRDCPEQAVCGTFNDPLQKLDCDCNNYCKLNGYSSGLCSNFTDSTSLYVKTVSSPSCSAGLPDNYNKTLSCYCKK